MNQRKSRQAESMAGRAQAGQPHCTAALLNHEGQCQACCLRDVLLAPHVKPAELERLLLSVGSVSFRRDDNLHREGEAGGHLYSLRSGVVKLVQHLPNGTARVVRLLRKGDVTGLEVLRHPAYRHSAVALGPVKACRVGKILMGELVRSSPALHDALLDRWERSLEAADLWITQISTGSVAARLARLIRFLAAQDEAAGANSVALPHREDMASMLGVAHETLCRAMSDFQHGGVLRRAGNSLFEFDPAAIDRIAAD